MARYTEKRTGTFKGTMTPVMALALLMGCASTSHESARFEHSVTASSSSNVDAEAQTADLVNQVAELEQLLASIQIEWSEQKPALERLVTTEADLQFLVQTLADMSQLEDEPSKADYLGQDAISPKKRQESLDALQSLVKSQEELTALLMDLSGVVVDIADKSSQVHRSQIAPVDMVQSGNVVSGSSAASSGYASAGKETFDSKVSTHPERDSSADTLASASASVTYAGEASPSGALECECDYEKVGPNSKISVTTRRSSSASAPSEKRDISWFGQTVPVKEAAPAGGDVITSQLDDPHKVGSAPIPELRLRTFSRRTLASELTPEQAASLKEPLPSASFINSRKSLAHYAQQLAFKLAGREQLLGYKVGVASFVYFDQSLQSTNPLGNQLAEALSTQLNGYGVKVIEYKLMDKIKVTEKGDVVLSRKASQLTQKNGMEFVVTGTLTPTPRGLEVNSKIVSLKDNVVISSAHTMIPSVVLSSI